MSRTVVHIVPNLPPPHEGVGSFALALAQALRADSAIESEFLVASFSWAPGLRGSEIPARRIPAAEADALCDALQDARADREPKAAVLLHYANYGYEPRGCPSWLVDGLARWKTRSQGRLVTVFHEVHATGPPWRSSFWLSPLQRRLAASLARLSEGLVTSMGYYRRILQRWVPGKEVAVLPVFSTVGEVSGASSLAARAPRLIVFGGPGNRALAYRELEPALALACATLGIEEVCDIGPGSEMRDPNLPARWTRLGPLPGAEVSALLAGSRAGFIAYPAPFLPKSTVFASYCAHRMLPICAWRWPRRKVEPAPPFWAPRPGCGASLSSLQELTDRAHAWYEGHSLSQHAASYRGLLFPS